MSLRSELGRVKGLGSTRGGTHHWWWQRITSVALVPLSLWFVVDLLRMVGAPHAAVVAWISSPCVTVLLLGLVAACFYHLQLGMQVIFDDYVHLAWLKVAVQIGLRLVVALCALTAAVAILRISMGMN